MTASTSTALAENDIAPLNYFLHSYGPAATPTMHLGWVFTAVMVVVFVIVASLLAGAIFRKRPAVDPRAIGREEQGMAWIYIGTGLSTCILLALTVYALVVLGMVSKPARAPGLTLTVTAYDWWWKIAYEDDDPSRRFVTANEIHIPIATPVLVKLKSADVIHAFWVPLLAGKMQTIPGLINQKWIEADVAGIYRGDCTQYCGVQHAHMGMEVVAETPDAFNQWREAQLKPASGALAVAVNAGKKLFLDRCAGCHTIRGTEAVGAHAPDLTHLLSRRLIAGGLLPNTPENLLHWILHTQQVKPGARMPSFTTTLSPPEISALAAFLATLH